MLHRLALRVLPQLNSLVTEPAVRKRKRLVMLLPGLVAFALYRALKAVVLFSNPLVFLACSGVFSLCAALWAYRMGRGIKMSAILKEDPPSRLLWIGGWIGFAYGVQLSLLVLALLRIFVGYDFLVHPDGPAMMALIIACTAVTRDAFEIGYLGICAQFGQRLITYPDGRGFRASLFLTPKPLIGWSILGCAATIIVMALFPTARDISTAMELAQVCGVSVIAACVAFLGFYAGELQQQRWWSRIPSHRAVDLVRFWIWPCLTFAATYVLVMDGVRVYVLGMPSPEGIAQIGMWSVAMGLLAAYAYYLGMRTFVERQVAGPIPENLQNCPFISNILRQAGVRQGQSSPALSTGSLSAANSSE